MRLSVMRLTYATGKVLYVIAKMENGRTEYWQGGIGWTRFSRAAIVFATQNAAIEQMEGLYQHDH